tara:strand:+ start:620 stop:736 length:117 start_codon:yes stop_codon:yes gene_type:complete
MLDMGYLRSLVDSWNDSMNSSFQAFLFVLIIILSGVEI